jgi:plasmid maintenance system antidote protein VapI
MTANEFAPVTPGEMLRQEFLAEYRLSQNQLAKALVQQTLLSGSACTSVIVRSSG